MLLALGTQREGRRLNKDTCVELAAGKKVLIFVHIPRTAGTTLHTVIDRQFPADTVFNILGGDVRKSITEFKSLPEEERQGIRCLKGHMAFGLHEYLPRPAVYVTMLRNPVDRVISHYYHVLETPGNILHHEIVSKNMSLRDYVSRAVTPQLTNGQTRLISGVERADSITGSDPVSAEIFERALSNLRDRFDILGICERFNESLILFKRHLGWRNTLYVRRNVARGRPSLEEVPRETIEIIEDQNEFDLELYDFAKRRFEELVLEQGAAFEKELQSFKRLNAAYDTAWRMYNLSERGLRKVTAAVRTLPSMQC